MCLEADKDNPLKGKYPLEFDEKGYTTCWKAYDNAYNGLYSPYYSGKIVTNGWIVSNRKSKKICGKNGDCRDFDNEISVYHGIHVYTDEIIAKKDWRYSGCVVPVRCHRSQLVAVSRIAPTAVFMKVFLKKSDFEKAIKE